MLPIVALTLSWHVAAPPLALTAHRVQYSPLMQEGAAPEGEQPETPVAAAPSPPAKFDLKGTAKEESKKGAGFNQFDPVLSATTFVSRRFGLAGGLALVALLAATEGNEIVKSLTDTGPTAGSGELITTPSGLQYVDILVAARGDTPLPGSVIGFNAKVTIGGNTLFDTTAGKDAKPVAFKYGQRPFQNVVCEGVEEGLKGMKPGAKRKLLIPASLAPKGVDVSSVLRLHFRPTISHAPPAWPPHMSPHPRRGLASDDGSFLALRRSPRVSSSSMKSNCSRSSLATFNAGHDNSYKCGGVPTWVRRSVTKLEGLH